MFDWVSNIYVSLSINVNYAHIFPISYYCTQPTANNKSEIGFSICPVMCVTLVCLIWYDIVYSLDQIIDSISIKN